MHSSYFKLIYENGQIYDQNIDLTVILGPIIKQKGLNILGFQKKNNKLKDVVLQLQVGSNMK